MSEFQHCHSENLSCSKLIEPILPLDLFRNQVFAVAALLSLLQLMVLVGLIIYLPLFLRRRPRERVGTHRSKK